MSHPSESDSSLPTQQSVDHVLNWFPENYDFDVFRDYMYGGSAGQTFYYWMYSDAPSIVEIGRGVQYQTSVSHTEYMYMYVPHTYRRFSRLHATINC